MPFMTVKEAHIPVLVSSSTWLQTLTLGMNLLLYSVLTVYCTW